VVVKLAEIFVLNLVSLVSEKTVLSLNEVTGLSLLAEGRELLFHQHADLGSLGEVLFHTCQVDLMLLKLGRNSADLLNTDLT
jgi:hypothetical protein